MEDFERVYSEYFDVVFRYVLSLCRDESLAEEVTQEAFFKALRRIGSFRGDCKLSVWLCQIAKNTYFNEIKRQKRQSEVFENTHPYSEDVAEMLIKTETATELHRALHGLDEPYKEVFWMRTFGELSFKEIGDIFGKTESWARVTFHRAKLKIKEEMK